VEAGGVMPFHWARRAQPDEPQGIGITEGAIALGGAPGTTGRQWYRRPMSSQDRVALVTGATGGLGGAITSALLGAGLKVVGVGRSEASGARLRDTLGDPTGLRTVAGDMTTETGVASLFAEAGDVGVLVNVAGGFDMGPVIETSLEAWDRLMALNARTVFLTCRQAFRSMGEGGGAIVNIGARPALGGAPGLSAYAASKAAVCNLTQSLAQEGLGVGIRVNAILPSVIDTRVNRQSMPDADFDAWVTPESLADVAAFLVSPAARDISGALVPVYGRS
jgi:NAD(P)-dependent dehydrogenase (short-subunit alcohol dehydrogenase family)